MVLELVRAVPQGIPDVTVRKPLLGWFEGIMGIALVIGVCSIPLYVFVADQPVFTWLLGISAGIFFGAYLGAMIRAAMRPRAVQLGNLATVQDLVELIVQRLGLSDVPDQGPHGADLKAD